MFYLPHYLLHQENLLSLFLEAHSFELIQKELRSDIVLFFHTTKMLLILKYQIQHQALSIY